MSVYRRQGKSYVVRARRDKGRGREGEPKGKDTTAKVLTGSPTGAGSSLYNEPGAGAAPGPRAMVMAMRRGLRIAEMDKLQAWLLPKGQGQSPQRD